MYRREAKKDVPVSKATVRLGPTGQAGPASTESAGWDPFEVWRDRIQRPREQSGKATLSEFERARQKS